MAELDEQTPTPHAAGRSRKLTKAVIWLAILPLVLPLLFYAIAGGLIGPMENEAWSHCGFDCPAATYLERLFWFLVLGPSMLLAVASILLGTIGLVVRVDIPPRRKMSTCSREASSVALPGQSSWGDILGHFLDCIPGSLILHSASAMLAGYDILCILKVTWYHECSEQPKK